MGNVVNLCGMVDYDNHFKFNDDVNFGSVSHGGCKCLDKRFTSYVKEKAKKEGYYILGINSVDSQGYSPVIDVKNDDWKECVYVVGEYCDGVMRDVITHKIINFVDDVDVIHFCAPHNFVRYSNNVWQVYPKIDGKDFEPRYYFSDLCYVTCNEIDKLDVLKYLEYFMYSSDELYLNYKNKLDEIQFHSKDEYNEILTAYNNDLTRYNFDKSDNVKMKKLVNYNK